ncbi:acyltransferase [Photobacterium damselae]
MTKIKKFFHQINKNGLIYIVTIILKIITLVLNKLTTFYYSKVLESCGKGSIIEFGVYIDKPYLVSIGEYVRIQRGSRFGSENDTGRLVICDNVNICRNVNIDHTGNCEIGENSVISEEVSIFTHSHGKNPKSIPNSIDKIIQNNVWLGYRSIILEKCTKIETSTIVGAGVIVSKDCIGNKVYVNPKNRVL